MLLLNKTAVSPCKSNVQMGNKLAKTLQKFLEPLETTDFYIFQSVLFSQQEYNFKIITIIFKKKALSTEPQPL